MSVTKNLAEVRQHIPDSVQLVCVSKFHPDEAIEEAYEAGERVFGESKVQELCGKYERLPTDIHWHFIGHLQTNKIKYLVPFVELIHGVDSYRLLTEINKQAVKINRQVCCLLQVHIATEETKFGFSEQELLDMFAAKEWKSLNNIQICGFMGMASLTDNHEQVRKEFRSLTNLFKRIQADFMADQPAFKELSMGMSEDYQIAIEEGSTMVRVGSSIFGVRNYNQ